MEAILISACLLGQKTTYKGGDNKVDYIEELNHYFDLVPFCPEVEGGLPTPRDPSEIRGSFVYQKTNKSERDVTTAYLEGARKALMVCSYLGIRVAIMKERSPSCGSHEIHDGYFRNRLIQGEGITVAALRRAGIRVLNEDEGREFLEEVKRNDALRAAHTAKEQAEDAAKEKPVEQPRPERRPYHKDDHGHRPEQRPFTKKGHGPSKGKPGFSYQGKTRPFAGKGRPFHKKKDQ